MNAVNEQRELANEIAETLANPIFAGVDVDEVRLSLLIFLVSHRVISVPFCHLMSENALPLSELHDNPQR